MAKKTKKEKIQAEKRREQFLYSLEALEKREGKSQEVKRGNGESPQLEIRREERVEKQVIAENFDYLRKDLLRIAVLATLLFGIQILLYLTIFTRL